MNSCKLRRQCWQTNKEKEKRTLGNPSQLHSTDGAVYMELGVYDVSCIMFKTLILKVFAYSENRLTAIFTLSLRQQQLIMTLLESEKSIYPFSELA